MAPNIKAARMIQGAIVPIVEQLPHGSRAHKRISSGVCPRSTVIPHLRNNVSLDCNIPCTLAHSERSNIPLRVELDDGIAMHPRQCKSDLANSRI